MAVTIKTIFASFLEEIVEHPKLKKSVLITRQYCGEYEARAQDSTCGFAYGGERITEQIGLVIYKGIERGLHIFYFVTTPRLLKTPKTDLRKIASEIIKDEETVKLKPYEYEIFNDVHSKEKSKRSRNHAWQMKGRK